VSETETETPALDAVRRALAERVLDAGALEVRDIDAGEEPFVYSTGNRGPGYVQVKGLVGQPALLKDLLGTLADQVLARAEFDFVNGNATGGMVPGWELRNQVSERLGREVPFCYLRGARKEGGHGETITGDRKNPLIQKGMRALIVEELVNYAGTMCNATAEYRRAGYQVSHGATILFYDQPEARARLVEHEVELIYLLTLPQLINVAAESGRVSPRLAASYREFLASPVQWQLDRGLVVPEDAAARAEAQGIELTALAAAEAVEAGAPASKVHAGVRYFARGG